MSSVPECVTFGLPADTDCCLWTLENEKKDAPPKQWLKGGMENRIAGGNIGKLWPFFLLKLAEVSGWPQGLHTLNDVLKLPEEAGQTANTKSVKKHCLLVLQAEWGSMADHSAKLSVVAKFDPTVLSLCLQCCLRVSCCHGLTNIHWHNFVDIEMEPSLYIKAPTGAPILILFPKIIVGK